MRLKNYIRKAVVGHPSLSQKLIKWNDAPSFRVAKIAGSTQSQLLSNPANYACYDMCDLPKSMTGSCLFLS